jgi:hypothetical protein
MHPSTDKYDMLHEHDISAHGDQARSNTFDQRTYLSDRDTGRTSVFSESWKVMPTPSAPTLARLALSRPQASTLHHLPPSSLQPLSLVRAQKMNEKRPDGFQRMRPANGTPQRLLRFLPPFL